MTRERPGAYPLPAATTPPTYETRRARMNAGSWRALFAVADLELDSEGMPRYVPTGADRLAPLSGGLRRLRELKLVAVGLPRSVVLTRAGRAMLAEAGYCQLSPAGLTALRYAGHMCDVWAPRLLPGGNLRSGRTPGMVDPLVAAGLLRHLDRPYDGYLLTAAGRFAIAMREGV